MSKNTPLQNAIMVPAAIFVVTALVWLFMFLTDITSNFFSFLVLVISGDPADSFVTFGFAGLFWFAIFGGLFAFMNSASEQEKNNG